MFFSPPGCCYRRGCVSRSWTGPVVGVGLEPVDPGWDRNTWGLGSGWTPARSGCADSDQVQIPGAWTSMFENTNTEKRLLRDVFVGGTEDVLLGGGRWGKRWAGHLDLVGVE